MTKSIETRSEDTQRALQRLESRYRHTQDALTGASAGYDSLRQTGDASERQLRQAEQRMHLLQKQLTRLIASIEQLEEQDDQATVTWSRSATSGR